MTNSTLTPEGLAALAPHASKAYAAAFPFAAKAMAACGILDSDFRRDHFLAQILHESGGFTIEEENLNYTTAERIHEVWPSRFPNANAAAPFVRNPNALAEKVYGGRMGNREFGDGFRYRGRGILQLTGRESYARIGKALNFDFEANPELVLEPETCFLVAASEWKSLGCNAAADNNDIVAVTKKVNGGLNGLDSRRQWLAKVRRVLSHPDLPSIDKPINAPARALPAIAVGAATAAVPILTQSWQIAIYGVIGLIIIGAIVAFLFLRRK